MTDAIVYSCEECDYSTKIRGNYNRHMKSQHSETIQKYKCDNCDNTFKYFDNKNRHMRLYCKGLSSPQNVSQFPQNVSQFPQNVSQFPQNVSQFPQNVSQFPQNVSHDETLIESGVCELCHKEFTRKDNLNRHILICKGTKDPLECHICHLICVSRNAKWRHLKTCKPVTSTELIPAPSNPEQGGQIVTNNNIQNNNIQNNVQNNINEQNNIQQINIITFSGDSNSRLNLSTEHITQAMMDDLFTRAKHYNHYKMNTDILAGFCDYLLEAIVNRCVRKTNARANYSQVHKGNNRWIQCHDSEVYDKFLTETTERFIEFIHCSKIKLKAAPFVIKKLDDFLNYMAEEGLCCEDRDTNLKVLKCYSKLIERLKSKIVQLTKSDE